MTGLLKRTTWLDLLLTRVAPRRFRGPASCRSGYGGHSGGRSARPPRNAHPPYQTRGSGGSQPPAGRGAAPHDVPRRANAGIRPLALALLAWAATSGAAQGEYALLEGEPGEYTLTCEVTAEKGWGGGAELRLAFDVTDEQNLAYARLADGKAALVRVAEGVEGRVGDAKPAQLPKAFSVSLQRREGRVRLVADRRVVLDVPWPEPIAGRAGMWVAGGVTAPEPLVQPYGTPVLYDDFMREADQTGPWESHAGTWRNTMVAEPQAEAAKSANPFTVRANGDPVALTTGGEWFWDSYRTSVSVNPLDADSVALAAYVKDAENMVQLRWHVGAADAPKARELVLVHGGKETTLATAPGGFTPGEWYELRLVVTPGRVEGLIDRFPAVGADTDALGEGGVGLWCAGGEAVFDDATVASPQDTGPQPPRINPVFLSDEIMTANQLFTPAGQWRAGPDGTFWNWGDFPADVSVGLPVVGLTDQPTQVLLRADGTGPAGAYAVSVAKVGEAVTAELTGPAGRAATGQCPVAGDGGVVVSVDGGTVRVWSREGEALRFEDPQPLAGRRVGLAGSVGQLTSLATVDSTHMRDYAFSSAPTDWFTGKGIWRVSARWSCQPGWTFFGGAHDENPVLWTKHEYHGDVTLEFFGSIKMDVPPPPGYSRPSDINAALCADGPDLGSGYAFVFAGWNNTKTAILRKGRVVAETGDVVFANPTSSNHDFHRHWFRVRAEKIGNRVALWVDGREALAYEDPEPLPGGRAGAWSFHNGLMVGRARLWFEEERPGGVVPCHMAAAPAPEPAMRAADQPVSDDFEKGVGEWQAFTHPPTTQLALDNSTAAAGKRSLKVTNLQPGGDFGVYASVSSFRATEWPKLSFDYRLTPAARVNVYVYAAGQWHAVKLSAEEPDSGGAPLLGEIAGVVADDQWHRAEFDLLTPLQTQHPESKALEVKYVAFAAPEESYLRCGLGGNGRGTTYWIDNFSIGP